MQPTFFRTAGSVQHAARMRARRRNQFVAAMLVVLLAGFGAYYIWFGTRATAGEPQPEEPAEAHKPGAGDGQQAVAANPQPSNGGSTPVARPVPRPRPADNSTPPPTPPIPDTPVPVARPQDRVSTPVVAISAEQRAALANKLAEADAKLRANDLLAARKLFNEVVDKGLAKPENDRIVKRLEELADRTLFNPVHVNGDPLTQIIQVSPPGYLDPIARNYHLRYQLLERINNTSAQRIQLGQNLKIIHGPFHATVDKADFTMTINIRLPGGPGEPTVPLLVRRFRVGLGEHDSTPAGVWEITNMQPHPQYTHPRTQKIIPKDDPEYPFGKLGYWIAIRGVEGDAVGQQRYGIHSTNEPDSIGKMASLGCVRMLDEDIKWVWILLRERQSRITVR